jgi:hypothetical protein
MSDPAPEISIAGVCGDDVDTGVGDLIADLCHFLEHRGFDREAILKIAADGVKHWHIERRYDNDYDAFNGDDNVEIIAEELDLVPRRSAGGSGPP